MIHFINVATFHFKIPTYFRVKIHKTLKIQAVKYFWIVNVYTHIHTHTNSTFPQINDNSKWSNFPQFSENNCMFKHCTQQSGVVHQYFSVLLSVCMVSNSLASFSWVSSWGQEIPYLQVQGHFQTSSTCHTYSQSGIRKIVSTWLHQQGGNNPSHMHEIE